MRALQGGVGALRPLHNHDPMFKPHIPFILLLIALLCPGLAWPQAKLLPAAPVAPEAAAEKPAPEPVVIPLTEVPRRAEAAEAMLADLEEESDAEDQRQKLDPELQALAREIDAGLAESRKTVVRTASITTLRRIEARWAPLRRRLGELSRDLSRRVAQSESDEAQLADMQKLWQRSQVEARGDGAPAELLQRMEEVVSGAAHAQKAVAATRGRAQAALNRVTVQEGRLEDALAATRRAREHVEENIFHRDAPALWEMRPQSWTPTLAAAQTRASFAAQWTALTAYGQRQQLLFLIHAGLFVVFAAALNWIRRRAPTWTEEPAEPGQAVSRLPDITLFRSPFATALLLAVFCGFGIYADGPLLLLAALAVLALAPAVAIARRLLERALRPALYVLAVFLVIDQLRIAAAPLDLLPRLLFLAEMAAAALFAAWLMRRASKRAAVRAAALEASLDKTGTQAPGSPAATHHRLAAMLHRVSFVALCFSLGALIANTLGYVGLSGLMGNALSAGAYTALVFYALIEILDGVFALLLHMPPLRMLAAVRRHRPLLRARFARMLRWLSFAGWMLVGLDQLALRERLFETAGQWLSAELTVGAIHFAMGDLIAFVLTLWAAFLVSRFLRFLLDEDVYPRLGLVRGLPYAISTMLNYTIVTLGFLAGVAALGLDMTKFTILAGAFSVGIGFGLQNIFNNFVSGIILLFERPVKVGDVIEVDPNTVGRVEHIGIRASTVRTSSGPDIIVPNGLLISGRVVNWTLGTRSSSILLPVSVPVNTDLKHAIEVLERSAKDHPMVVEHPAPSAIAVRLGPDFLGLELRAWTDRADYWKEIRSELAVAVTAALAAEGMALR